MKRNTISLSVLVIVVLATGLAAHVPAGAQDIGAPAVLEEDRGLNSQAGVSVECVKEVELSGEEPDKQHVSLLLGRPRRRRSRRRDRRCASTADDAVLQSVSDSVDKVRRTKGNVTIPRTFADFKRCLWGWRSSGSAGRVGAGDSEACRPRVL